VSWIYSVREGCAALARSKLSSVLSILTMTVALFFLSLFGLAIAKGWLFVKKLKDQLLIEVFIHDSASEETIADLDTTLGNQPEIEAVLFVSKDEALAEYTEEYGSDVGLDLGENPLPASFRLRIKADFQDETEIASLKERIEALPGIDEAIYRFDLLRLIENYLGVAVLIVIVVGSALTISSIILISNSIRFSIIARRDSIEIMSLVGATPAFIRRPFVIEGGIQGFLAALLSMVLLTILLWTLAFFGIDASVNRAWISLLGLALGVLLGVAGSWMAIRSHLVRLLY
jgi:cell division transport system permease protein